jgi:hypothetical protein
MGGYELSGIHLTAEDREGQGQGEGEGGRQ